MAFRGFDIDNQYSKKKLQPHPSTYTDFDNIDESPWMHEDKKPWYSWLEGKANEVTDSVSEGYDKMIQEAGEAYEYNSDDISADSFGDPYEGSDSGEEQNYFKAEVPDFIKKRRYDRGILEEQTGAEAAYNWKPELDEGFDEKLGPDSQDGGGESIDETSWWDGISDSMESDGKPLTPMQKFAGKMIMDQFSEKPETPMATIGSNPVTPGKQFDMSYLKRRPTKKRYQANQGLLGRA
jgi:hypothetical protein